jgi:DNA-binding response OmpR family regulator
VKLLVVEDEVRMAQALRRGLQAEGFAVDLAHDGEEGLRLALEGDYAALVLDVMLPRLSGYRVAQELRAAGNWVPVLMLSAKDGEYDEADGLDVGADDYLTKPFSYVVLVARLRALIRRGAPDRPAVLTAGDLTLDPATRAVQRGPADVTLTPREFGRPEHRRGLRRLPAPQDRRAVRPAGHRDGARGRLPAGGRRWLSAGRSCGYAGRSACGAGSPWRRPLSSPWCW